MSWSPADDDCSEPVRWKAKGAIMVTVHPFDPRTGEDLPDAVLWLPFPWTHMTATPDDSEEDIREDLRDNLGPAVKNAADQLLDIDLEVCDFEDLYIIWEVDE